MVLQADGTIFYVTPQYVQEAEEASVSLTSYVHIRHPGTNSWLSFDNSTASGSGDGEDSILGWLTAEAVSKDSDVLLE